MKKKTTLAWCARPIIVKLRRAEFFLHIYNTYILYLCLYIYFIVLYNSYISVRKNNDNISILVQLRWTHGKSVYQK